MDRQVSHNVTKGNTMWLFATAREAKEMARRLAGDSPSWSMWRELWTGMVLHRDLDMLREQYHVVIK